MIKILIADDSVMIRMALEKVLSSNPDFKIVGFCNNGEDVLEKVKTLSPDVITLDIEMPKMNGLQVLEKLMEVNPIPVIMVSSLTKEGAEETIKALELGAVDVFLKPDAKNTTTLKKGFEELSEKIRVASKAKVFSQGLNKLRSFLKKEKVHDEVKKDDIHEEIIINTIDHEISSDFKPEMIIIGISTGGPASLNKIIPKLSPELPSSIVIAQHMPLGFTKSLATRLNQISKIEVKEIENNEVIKKGTVYVAPSGFQTRIKRKFGQYVFSVEDDNSKEFLFKPSIDVIFSSASEVYKDNLLGIVMTGMGNDGTKGAEQIKKFGGKVFAQSEETCIIGSMPKSIIKADLADKIYDLDVMSSEIERLFY